MNNHYSLPAGKVEKDESFMDCAIREALEETAVKLTKKQLVFSHVQHRNYDGEPWIDVYYEVVDCDQEPVNNEPHMHSELKWFDVDDLPANLVPGMREVFESIKEGSKYSEVFFN